VKRRKFITLLGGAAAWPLAAKAQQPRKVWRIGYVALNPRPVALEGTQYEGFVRGMRELGHVEGRDFVIEWRFAEQREELLPVLAGELIRANVDIFVSGDSSVARTSTIPIIMTSVTDPVGGGLVTSLARPSSNVTGLASSTDDSAPKRLELLAKAVPSLSRIGFVADPKANAFVSTLKNTQAAALAAGLQLVEAPASSVQEIEGAIAAMITEGVGAALVVSSPVTFAGRQRIGELALHHRLPTMSPYREFVEAGGLMSYGESRWDLNRRAAFYVDKIMKGATPADLPVQQPTRFFLTINRKSADALGLSIPIELLVLADELIE
jgi:ABC-type uncharacterized transport system substrate-binding protein